jgi:hypothetical protein
MFYYHLTTLIDITRTDERRNDKFLMRSQQSNFDSLIQGIGLRANVFWNIDPIKDEGKIPYSDGKATFWSWTFMAEQQDVFLKGEDPVGLLLDDLNHIPVITGLEDTANFKKDAFITRGELTNTWVLFSAQ